MMYTIQNFEMQAKIGPGKRARGCHGDNLYATMEADNDDR